MTKRLARLLEHEVGVDVRFTRTADYFVPLRDRTSFANAQRADLFLSIHVNYVPNSGPRGFEVWVRRGDRASRELASYIRGEMNRAIATEDRGIKDDRALYVLRNTSCPAALVEVGFISHPSEERLLLDPVHRQRLAGVLAESVRKYLAARR